MYVYTDIFTVYKVNVIKNPRRLSVNDDDGDKLLILRKRITNETRKSKQSHRRADPRRQRTRYPCGLDFMVNAMEYIDTDFGADSSIRVPFRARKHRQSQTSLNSTGAVSS